MFDLSARSYEHARRLAVDIGPRPAGSPENVAAAEYIEQIFQESEHSFDRQVFDCTGWSINLRIGAGQDVRFYPVSFFFVTLVP
jgi:hypothetical protein